MNTLALRDCLRLRSELGFPGEDIRATDFTDPVTQTGARRTAAGRRQATASPAPAARPVRRRRDPDGGSDGAGSCDATHRSQITSYRRP
ncbi:hypothetical protein [Streptomyces sp. JNUCC 63]